MTFIHAIDPVLFSLGPIQIRWYGLVYAVGFLCTYFFLAHLVKKKVQPFEKWNLATVDELILALMIGGIAGARLGFFLFYNPLTIFGNPLEVLQVWNGGMSFHGGVIGGLLAVLWFSKKHNFSFFTIADVLTMPLALGLFFGRIANFINGELVGTVTQVNWGVNFGNEMIDGERVYRHPSQLYESAKNLLMFGMLLLVQSAQVGFKHSKGLFLGLFLAMYGILRFTITFLREDPRWLGLSMGQYLSLATAIVGLVILFGIPENRKRFMSLFSDNSKKRGRRR